MAYGAPEVDNPPEEDSIVVPEIRRERVVVRRRRARGRHHKRVVWTARVSRRKVARAIVVCATVLVMMALGLYYTLSREESAPAEGFHRRGAAPADTHAA